MVTIAQLGDRFDKEKQPFLPDSTDGWLPSSSGHEGRRLAITYFKSTNIFKTRLEAQDNEQLRTETELRSGLEFDRI